MDIVFERAFGAVIALIAIGTLLFFGSLWFYLTKREFGVVHFNVAYFTRNDHDRTHDALHFRQLRYAAPLKQIHLNKFLFWVVIWKAFRVTLQEPVIDFGTSTHIMLAPFRGALLAMTAKEELKRVAGQAFVQTSYQLALVYDRSEDRRSYVIRAIMVRTSDLKNFAQYRAKSPATRNADNWALLCKIADTYRDSPERFVSVQIVT